MPIASATAGGHRDCPILASVAQWPEIQPPVSQGQIVSADLYVHCTCLITQLLLMGYAVLKKANKPETY